MSIKARRWDAKLGQERIGNVAFFANAGAQRPAGGRLPQYIISRHAVSLIQPS